MRAARRRLAGLVGLLVVLVLGACSTVPTSSPTVQITQAAARPTDEVGIEPLPPEEGATPDEVVRGFIDATASTVHGHPVARQFLAPAAAKSWSDEAGITVISTPSAVTTDVGAVSFTAQLVGTVDTAGVFTVATQRSYSRTFTLQQVRKQWRILDPPDGLVMLEPDFERLYDQRNAYFIDPTGQRLVPDPRYLITGQSQPTTLVQRLIDGASPALADPVVKDPLAGAQLRRAVTVTSRAATVDLTGIGNQPATVLSEICAQIVWSLDQLALRSVEVLVDGQPVDIDGVPLVQTTSDWESFDPAATPVSAVGHYIDGGALKTVDGKPAPGPAGTGGYGIAAAAVSADQHSGDLATMAATTSNGGGATLLVGPYGGALGQVAAGNSFTAPTVSATRPEFWVVRDGATVLRVAAGGQPQNVDATSLTGLGAVQSLRLSPDGTRAAVIVDGTLYVATVVRSDDGGVALRAPQPIAPSLTLVSDVAWDTSASLLVLAGDGSQDRTVPYTVSVDGFGLEDIATSGLPSQPTAIGAAPGQPTLVIAHGTVWQQSGGTWATLLRGQEPVPGSAPFYPL
jgi:hypothetical protein